MASGRMGNCVGLISRHKIDVAILASVLATEACLVALLVKNRTAETGRSNSTIAAVSDLSVTSCCSSILGVSRAGNSELPKEWSAEEVAEYWKNQGCDVAILSPDRVANGLGGVALPPVTKTPEFGWVAVLGWLEAEQRI